MNLIELDRALRQLRLGGMVRNRFMSESIAPDRPKKWLPDLGSYVAGPLTKYKNVKGGASGNREKGNKAEQRKRDNLAAREAARAAVVGDRRADRAC